MAFPGMGLGRQETFLAASGDCRIPVNRCKFLLLLFPCAVKCLCGRGGSSRVVLAGAVRGGSLIVVLLPLCSVGGGILAGPSGTAAEANQSRNDPKV